MGADRPLGGASPLEFAKQIGQGDPPPIKRWNHNPISAAGKYGSPGTSNWQQELIPVGSCPAVHIERDFIEVLL